MVVSKEPTPVVSFTPDLGRDLGYVIYGLFTIFLVIIPNVMAFWFARLVPFPPLAQTLADLQRRWRPAAMVIVTGLVILMIHLAFAPWPDIFRHRIGG